MQLSHYDTYFFYDCLYSMYCKMYMYLVSQVVWSIELVMEDDKEKPIGWIPGVELVRV